MVFGLGILPQNCYAAKRVDGIWTMDGADRQLRQTCHVWHCYHGLLANIGFYQPFSPVNETYTPNHTPSRVTDCWDHCSLHHQLLLCCGGVAQGIKLLLLQFLQHLA